MNGHLILCYIFTDNVFVHVFKINIDGSIYFRFKKLIKDENDFFNVCEPPDRSSNLNVVLFLVRNETHLKVILQ